MSAATGQSHLIAVGSDSPQARLCDIRSGAFAHALTGHSEAVWACAWSPRSEFLLATGSADQTVRCAGSFREFRVVLAFGTGCACVLYDRSVCSRSAPTFECIPFLRASVFRCFGVPTTLTKDFPPTPRFPRSLPRWFGREVGRITGIVVVGSFSPFTRRPLGIALQ